MQLRRESHFCISQARLYCRKIIYMVYLVEKSILYCNYLKPSWTYSRLMTELSEYIYPYTSRPSTCFRKSLNTRLSHKLFRKLVYVIFSLILTIESIFYYLAFFMPHNNCAPITQVDAVNAKTKINVQPLLSRPSDDMSRSSFCTISIKSQINYFILVS